MVPWGDEETRMTELPQLLSGTDGVAVSVVLDEAASLPFCGLLAAASMIRRNTQ